MSLKITERTTYPLLINIIKDRGGTGVSEIKINSEPDIIFNLYGIKWILSVKIGETIPILKQAFIQYQRHKEEAKIEYGMILFIPDKIRSVKPTENKIRMSIETFKCTCLIDTPVLKEELRSNTFPQVLKELELEIVPRISKREEKGYPLDTVIDLLQNHVTELIDNINITNEEILKIITNQELLTNLGSLKRSQVIETSEFLAAYIILSQIFFLRLYSRTFPSIMPKKTGLIDHNWLREAFTNILDVNYRPIYKIDVLNVIPVNYIQDTFDLIWGLEIERLRYELPGRIFHELMPKKIRKLLAAFYTRPQAADLLARLVIKKSSDTIYDPACGSGTILTSAYRRKLNLFNKENGKGNPHKQFCEKEIFGSDIMPFAVHLTSANLASMDPTVGIERTQIIQGDSLKLSKRIKYTSGVQTTLFPPTSKGYDIKGENQTIDLRKVDNIIMNPPFTKLERGIKKYIQMDRFVELSGSQVGLWGHFLVFIDEFIKNEGMIGAVIPISILRGTEAMKVREFIFSNWTPLYIIKAIYNYGFSEWSEYRDILFIAKKRKPSEDHQVKFILIKKNLKKLEPSDIDHIANLIEVKDFHRSKEIDIQSFQLNELKKRYVNLMWFCGVCDFKNRDIFVSFIDNFEDKMDSLPNNYFKEGYRPVPKGVSSFMFFTRNIHPSRIKNAFLSFNNEDTNHIYAKTNLETPFKIEKVAVKNTLRTGTGLNIFDLTHKLDYISYSTYKNLNRIIKASQFRPPKNFQWKNYWKNLQYELNKIETNIVTMRRINPYSPNNHLISFYSHETFHPSNTLNVVLEKDLDRAKAFNVLLNSILFLVQFFLLKEETTGRYIDIRFYDFYEMRISPKDNFIKVLGDIFEEFSKKSFPSFMEQFDKNFQERYKAFWKERRKKQKLIQEWERRPIEPSEIRLNFDLKICNSLNIPIDKQDLLKIYSAIVNEMIITRGLKRD
ncbi:MAG: class I SAM-dependent DNA methyltransferase [Promethearchaeota archaeon]